MRDDSALALLAAVLVVGSCAPETDPAFGLEQPVTGKRFDYVCESGLEFPVELHDQRATVYLQGRTLPLLREPDHGGVRYGDGSTVLWVGAEDARLEEDLGGTGTALVHGCRTRGVRQATG
ncbi:MAG TPA: hypothetical protein VFG21_04265 [Xanthomonadaceae bacterium]|nr:hypothetical protein [Xanthomonadaceae bacterium]